METRLRKIDKLSKHNWQLNLFGGLVLAGFSYYFGVADSEFVWFAIAGLCLFLSGFAAALLFSWWAFDYVREHLYPEEAATFGLAQYERLFGPQIERERMYPRPNNNDMQIL